MINSRMRAVDHNFIVSGLAVFPVRTRALAHSDRTVQLGYGRTNATQNNKNAKFNSRLCHEIDAPPKIYEATDAYSVECLQPAAKYRTCPKFFFFFCLGAARIGSSIWLPTVSTLHFTVLAHSARAGRADSENGIKELREKRHTLTIALLTMNVRL